MKLKIILVRLHWLSSEQLGVDFLKLFRSVRGLPQYIRDFIKFKAGFNGSIKLVPCLGDRFAEAGATKSEYFWQDLLVARRIFLGRPIRHVDVGSRLDGFVAHVASFREVEVFDIRPVSANIPGVVFRQADLMSKGSISAYVQDGRGYCDSVSCLHAIEHFGLGRYSDPVDPLGYARGIRNLALLLLPGGRLYLSTPIGRQRVEFNANWVFDPSTIVEVAVAAGLKLDELTVIDQCGATRDILQPDYRDFGELGQADYQLGIFYFTKMNSVASGT
jgi:hypothetical protein